MDVIKEYCMNAGAYGLGQMRKKVQAVQDALQLVELPSQAVVKSLVSRLVGETLKFRYLSWPVRHMRIIVNCLLLSVMEHFTTKQWKL